jgi:hypothetical protein
MKHNHVIGAACAIALASVVALGAQAPGSQAPTTPPQAPTQQTPTPPQSGMESKATEAGTITLTGCVQLEGDIAGKTVMGTTGDEFVLTHAQMGASAHAGSMTGAATGTGAQTGTGTAAGTGTGTGTGTATGSAAGTGTAGGSMTGTAATGTAGTDIGKTYELTGDREDELKPYVGQRVEITGRLDTGVSATGAAVTGASSGTPATGGTSAPATGTTTSGTPATGAAATGTITATGGAAAKPRFIVESIRPLNESCGTQPGR